MATLDKTGKVSSDDGMRRLTLEGAAYKAAAAKALSELILVLPYLPNSTATIAQGVIDRIIATSPPIPHREYGYCPRCGEQHLMIGACHTEKETPDGD